MYNNQIIYSTSKTKTT